MAPKRFRPVSDRKMANLELYRSATFQGFRLVSDCFQTGFRLASDWLQTEVKLVSNLIFEGNMLGNLMFSWGKSWSMALFVGKADAKRNMSMGAWPSTRSKREQTPSQINMSMDTWPSTRSKKQKRTKIHVCNHDVI